MRTQNIISVCCCLAFAILLVRADDTAPYPSDWNFQSDPRFDARISDLLAKNVMQLSQEIGTAILQDSDKPTEVISPLSIYTALSILLMGSNKQTFNELMSLLRINNDSVLSQSTWKMHEEFSLMIDDLNRDIPHPGRRRQQTAWKVQRTPMNKFNKDSESQQQISVANGIFYQNGYSIRPDFRSAMESAYKSTLQRLDFANKPELSTKFINSWVSEKTQGKITNMVSSPLPPSTKTIIASALYFKALWERSFIEEGTRPQEFYPDGVNRPAITVDTMATGGNFPFYDSKEYDCRIIGIPYRKHLTTMYIIMPNNSTRHRLRQFQATLTADKIQDMISKMEWRTAMVLLPKLHITNKVDLKMILNRMGVRSLFNYDQSDLSLISSGVETPIETNHRRLSISENTNQFLFARFGEENDANHPTPKSDGGTSQSNNTTTEKISANKTESKNVTGKRERRSAKTSVVTYKASSSDFHAVREPLRLKDLVIGKRITKSYPHKKTLSRGRRDIPFDPSLSLKRLDLLRSRLNSENAPNPRLFADELIHQIDLTVNEVGTEGGAATITTLRRSGPDVWFRVNEPFLFLVRHEDTKLPIFYGAVFEPTN